MVQQLEDMMFADLVDEATREIHDGLLTGGGKGLRSAVWTSMNTAIAWRKARDVKQEKVDKEPAKL